MPATQPVGATVSTANAGQVSTFIIKMAGSPASYVRDSAGVAHPIPNGGTYICNANNYPTEYNVSPTTFNQLVRSIGSAATCPPAGNARQLTSRTADGYLLRDADGNAWVVQGGYRIRCSAAASTAWQPPFWCGTTSPAAI